LNAVWVAGPDRQAALSRWRRVRPAGERSECGDTVMVGVHRCAWAAAVGGMVRGCANERSWFAVDADSAVAAGPPAQPRSKCGLPDITCRPGNAGKGRFFSILPSFPQEADMTDVGMLPQMSVKPALTSPQSAGSALRRELLPDCKTCHILSGFGPRSSAGRSQEIFSALDLSRPNGKS
jgi:hypothetical protein